MSSPSRYHASPHVPSGSSCIWYFAPGVSLKSPHFLRSTFGPRSRHFSGNQVCQTCGGSTTWSSTLMIFGSSRMFSSALSATRSDMKVLYPENPNSVPDVSVSSGGRSGEDAPGELLDEFAALGGPAAYEVVEPGGFPRVGLAGDGIEVGLDGKRRGAADGSRIASGRFRVRADPARLRGHLLDRAEAVPHVGVARRDRHHPLLARGTDPDRRVRLLHRTRAQRRVVHLEVTPVEREAVGGEQTAHDLHGFLERVDAVLRTGERDAELTVLGLPPPRAIAQLEPAVRRVVD